MSGVEVRQPCHDNSFQMMTRGGNELPNPIFLENIIQLHSVGGSKMSISILTNSVVSSDSVPEGGRRRRRASLGMEVIKLSILSDLTDCAKSADFDSFPRLFFGPDEANSVSVSAVSRKHRNFPRQELRLFISMFCHRLSPTTGVMFSRLQSGRRSHWKTSPLDSFSPSFAVPRPISKLFYCSRRQRRKSFLCSI